MINPAAPFFRTNSALVFSPNEEPHRPSQQRSPNDPPEQNRKNNGADPVYPPGAPTFPKLLGILIGAVIYHFLSVLIIPDSEDKRADQKRKQVIAAINTIILAVSYLYSWSYLNPHVAANVENSPSSEVPLMLTAAYYLLNMFPTKSILDTCHHVVSILAIMELLTEGRAAYLGVTFALLVEVANLVYILRNLAIICESDLASFLRLLYPIVFVVVRIFVLWHLSYNIIFSDDVPDVAANLSALLFMCSIFYCFRMGKQVMKGPEEGPDVRRSRSRTRRYRGKSRSRSGRSRSSRRSRGRSRT